MRLSEVITLYLAAAAPVGVAYFQTQPARPDHRRAARLARATCLALCWPLSLAALLLRQHARARGPQPPHRARANAAAHAHEQRIEVAQRTLLGTLYATEDLLETTCGPRGLRAQTAAAQARATIERYAGLAAAAGAAASDDPPTARELELGRVAGRKGADLLLAGQCLHRRNVARLRVHHAQASTDLIHALAELLERVEHDLPARPAAGQPFAQLYWLIIRAFAQTFDLLSLFDDQPTALRVARLLDAACAWARRHEVINLPRTDAAQVGGRPCMPQTPPQGVTHSRPQPAPQLTS